MPKGRGLQPMASGARPFDTDTKWDINEYHGPIQLSRKKDSPRAGNMVPQTGFPTPSSGNQNPPPPPLWAVPPTGVPSANPIGFPPPQLNPVPHSNLPVVPKPAPISASSATPFIWFDDYGNPVVRNLPPAPVPLQSNRQSYFPEHTPPPPNQQYPYPSAAWPSAGASGVAPELLSAVPWLRDVIGGNSNALAHQPRASFPAPHISQPLQYPTLVQNVYNPVISENRGGPHQHRHAPSNLNSNRPEDVVVPRNFHAQDPQNKATDVDPAYQPELFGVRRTGKRLSPTRYARRNPVLPQTPNVNAGRQHHLPPLPNSDPPVSRQRRIPNNSGPEVVTSLLDLKAKIDQALDFYAPPSVPPAPEIGRRPPPAQQFIWFDEQGNPMLEGMTKKAQPVAGPLHPSSKKAPLPQPQKLHGPRAEPSLPSHENGWQPYNGAPPGYGEGLVDELGGLVDLEDTPPFRTGKKLLRKYSKKNPILPRLGPSVPYRPAKRDPHRMGAKWKPNSPSSRLYR